MKVRIPYGKLLSKKEQKARDDEIRRQILSMDKEYSIDCYASILWALHISEGWQKRKLRKVHKVMLAEHKRLLKHYELGPEDYTWLCRRLLMDIGVDVAAWSEEEDLD